MIWTNLDQICRRSLLEKGLPLHFYIEFLVHAASCLRQLSIDSLKIVRTVKLPVNSYYAANLPDDFVDDVVVTIPVGQYLQPIPKRDNINSLLVHDSLGNFIPYKDVDSAGETIFGFNTNWLWFWNVNDYGEPTGRYFGAGGGATQNGYKIVKERRQIQFAETFTSSDAVLLYISDGQSADNATQVDVMAFDAIQDFIDWRTSPNANVNISPEGQKYYNSRRLLRARLDDLTVTDIKNIIRSNYHASIKN